MKFKSSFVIKTENKNLNIHENWETFFRKKIGMKINFAQFFFNSQLNFITVNIDRHQFLKSDNHQNIPPRLKTKADPSSNSSQIFATLPWREKDKNKLLFIIERATDENVFWSIFPTSWTSQVIECARQNEQGWVASIDFPRTDETKLLSATKGNKFAIWFTLKNKVSRQVKRREWWWNDVQSSELMTWERGKGDGEMRTLDNFVRCSSRSDGSWLKLKRMWKFI